MKLKLLVFFGIVALGLVISLLTLNRIGKDDAPDGKTTASTEGGAATEGTVGTEGASSAGKGESPGSPNAGTTETNRPGGDAAKGSGSPAMAKGTPGSPSAPSSGAGSGDAEETRAVFRSGKDSPEAVVGGLANTILKKDYTAFLEAAGEDAVPEPIRPRLKTLIEDPKLKLADNRPFWEVAKQTDSARWIMELVPADAGAADTSPDSASGRKPGKASHSIILDIAKLSPSEFSVSRVGFPRSIQEVISAVGNPASQLKIDSLEIAHAFSSAVLGEDFQAARKLCKPNVTDERIAGLMIALEEGRFKLREDRPLIVTLSRDDVTWVLSRVNSDDENSEFALELEKGEGENNWMISGLTFGKVIRTLAKGVEGPYSPLVEDPTGGESLVVYFEFDESGLTTRADHQMKIVANILNKDKNRKIRITGHADALGSDDYNRLLSKKRADAIREAIISRGANPEQVITEGYGETRPRKPNFKADGSDNPLGRSANRRAEVYLDF